MYKFIPEEPGFSIKFNSLSINRYATVTTSQGALIIGGTAADSVALNTVACYNNSTWTKLDDLQTARYAHRAIVNGDKVYVIGGNLSGLV